MKPSFFEEQTMNLTFKQKVLLKTTYYFTRLTPGLSAAFALKYLCNPRSRRSFDLRTKVTPEEFEIKYKTGFVKAYKFSPSKEGEKSVLLTHGWADTTTRFTQTIDQLVESGFTVWSFDHIGHGKSAESTAHLFNFIKGLKLTLSFIKEHDKKEVTAILAHSMGSLAVLNLEENLLKDKKIILVSAPTLFFENMFTRITSFGLSALMLKNLLENVSKKRNLHWESLAPVKQAHKTNENFLFVHDIDDQVCSFDNIKELLKDRTHQFHETKGLGHLKILKDSEVLSVMSEFIS